MTWTKLIALGCLLTACASARAHIDVSPAEVPLPEAPRSSGDEVVTAPVEPAETGPAVLTRATLRQAVTEGIGAFLARVEVSPFVIRGRFVGFRLDRARNLPRWNAAGMDLHRGDVITRVNGSPIERPEQAQAAFLALADAGEIVLEVIRAGAPVTLRLAVLPDDVRTVTVSDASAPAPTTAR